MEQNKSLKKSMNKIFSQIIIAILFFSFSFAQEMTKEEWQKQMTETRAKRDASVNDLENLVNEIAKLSQIISKLDVDIVAAENELFKLYETNKAELEQFSKELEKHEARVNDLMRISDEELIKFADEISIISTRVDEMVKMKPAKLPRFATRIFNLQSNLTTLMRNSKAIASSESEAMSQEKYYVVGTWAKNRDCLWNIAKKPDVYANAFMWPKIWQGNKEQIKNPDIIHPGQKLRIPENEGGLSPEEKAALRNYYLRKQKNL